MEIRNGWLERSLERAHANIKERPERLKPERYREKPIQKREPKKARAARSR